MVGLTVMAKMVDDAKIRCGYGLSRDGAGGSLPTGLITHVCTHTPVCLTALSTPQ